MVTAVLMAASAAALVAVPAGDTRAQELVRSNAFTAASSGASFDDFGQSLLGSPLRLSDGSYVIIAKFDVQETSATAPLTVACDLVVEAFTADSTILRLDSSTATISPTLAAGVTISDGPLGVNVTCSTEAGGDTADALNIKVIALPVGGLAP